MSKRSARGTITRESVVDAALQIADRDGFDGVTIRAIAVEVGTTPMALYTYFPNKEALYAGMRERLFSVHVGAARISRQTWQSMLEGLARGIYQVMREHPNWTPVMAHRSGPATSGLAFIEDSLRSMMKDGFALEEAMRAYGCAMSFAVGSALWDRIIMGAGDGPQQFLARLKELPVRAPGQHASLASAAAKTDRWVWDEVFEHGIRSLLMGIEAQCARSGRQSNRPPRARRTPA
jgi:AcrR family transcriptional regulator